MFLSTPRLSLRPFRADDLDDLLGFATREEYWRHLPCPRQTAETVASTLLGRIGATPDASRNWYFAAELTETGRVIGAFRITERDPLHHQGDIGWSLNPDFWGKGLAAEGATALLDFGFGEIGLEKIAATTDAENANSWRVMERIGMRQEGLLRHHRQVRGEWRDNLLYGIIAAEHRPVLVTSASPSTETVAALAA